MEWPAAHSATELKELRERLAEERKLDPAIIDLLRRLPRRPAHGRAAHSGFCAVFLRS